jgi:hypothetical protein
VGTYEYGAECASYKGVETLDLTENADGTFEGTLVDSTLAGIQVAQGTVKGRRTGAEVTFTGTYKGSYEGKTSSFTGTLKGNQLEDGKLTGVCGQGARVTFSKR